VRAFLSILTAGLLFVAAAESMAQTQQPKTPAQTPAAEKAKAVEGAVKSVDAAKKMVTLEDGTTLIVSDAAKLKELKPGAMIKASYEEKGGQKVTTSLEVMKK
jgi:Cu/Ag efflux protein CusF